ncbi:hypothetical protein GXM_00455 [Nostoc sphaeroides CCNUC1]|uniref:Uncharacterized protein n=1 Tax=Nostoc sphaeroides CCNUC1 TaxID=2653204 RepID=A0A5P8VRC7_9NOSO|nr:hypothetical protein GXM_00455 [Nostoc sphaeroides CCNUC1]
MTSAKLELSVAIFLILESIKKNWSILPFLGVAYLRDKCF